MNYGHGLYSPHQQSHHLSLADLLYIDRVGRQKYPVSIGPEFISMIVVPSSGHCKAQYLASAAYRMLQKDTIDNVIIIAQSDELMFHGVALPMHRNNHYVFGNSALNITYIDQLIKQSLFHYNELAFQLTDDFQHHIQCMRHYLDHAVQITPLLVGHITHENALDVVDQISKLCNEHTLVIIITDVTLPEYIVQYGSGFVSLDANVYHEDASIIQAIQGMPLRDQKNIKDDCLQQKNAIVVLLALLQQTTFQTIQSYFVGYDTSVDRSDNSYQDFIESYGTFIFQQKNDDEGYRIHLGLYEQSQLICVAKNSLLNIFEPIIFEKPYMISYEMMQLHGAFVSLYAMTDHGTLLRGCMGHMQPKAPLYQMIYDITKHAACYDDRFYTLMHQEIKSTLISISIITDLYQVKNYTEIYHTDGIWFTYYNKSAIFLPSDNPIHNWNSKEMLSDLCFQAGAPLFSWQEPSAKIFKFQSIAFQEV